MDDRELYDRLIAGTEHFVRLMGEGSEGAHVVERDGVVASVAPACPERSVVNSACYRSEAGLAAAYDELAAAYDAAGIEAWTVWAPPADEEARALLRERGHVMDADPEVMALLLAGYESPVEQPAAWSRGADPATVADLNDRAYGYEGSFARAMARWPEGGGEWYLAELDGEPACCLGILDHDGDAEVTLVATDPEARGRGLATALLAHALVDARERGLETSSLVATRMGRSVYERLGFRDLGPIEMWERRAA